MLENDTTPGPDDEPEPTEEEIAAAWQPHPMAELLWDLATTEMRVLQHLAHGPEEDEL